MTARDAVVWGLVICGGALAVVASLGVLLMRDALDRLHYTGLAMLGGALLSMAVLVRGGWSLIGLRAILLAALLLVGGPVITHATARAIHERGPQR